MVDSTIGNLPAESNPGASMALPGVQGGATKKVMLSTLASSITTQFGLTFPVSSVVTPSGTLYAGSPIIFNGSTSVLTTVYVSLARNGVDEGTRQQVTVSGGAWSKSLTPAQAGSYTVRVYALASGGVILRESSSFTVSAAPNMPILTLHADKATLNDASVVNYWVEIAGVIGSTPIKFDIAVSGTAATGHLRHNPLQLALQSLAQQTGVSVSGSTVTVTNQAVSRVSWVQIGRSWSDTTSSAVLTTTISNPVGSTINTATHSLTVAHAPPYIDPAQMVADLDAGNLGTVTKDGSGHITSIAAPDGVVWGLDGGTGPTQVTIDGRPYLHFDGNRLATTTASVAQKLGVVPASITVVFAGRRNGGDNALLAAHYGATDNSNIVFNVHLRNDASTALRYTWSSGGSPLTACLADGLDHIHTLSAGSDERVAHASTDMDYPTIGSNGYTFHPQTVTVGKLCVGGSVTDWFAQYDLRRIRIFSPALDIRQIRRVQREMMAQIGKTDTRETDIDSKIASLPLNFCDDFNELAFSSVHNGTTTSAYMGGRPALWQDVLKGQTETDSQGRNTGNYAYVIGAQQGYFAPIEGNLGANPFTLIDGTVCRITASRASVTGINGGGMVVTTGQIQTIASSFTKNLMHGYKETRVRLPAGLSALLAQGLWPAIWDMPVDYVNENEIDQLDTVNRIKDGVNLGFISGPNQDYSDRHGGGGFTPIPHQDDGDFHNIGFYWDCDGNIWFVYDGFVVRKLTVPREDLWLWNNVVRSWIIGLQVGGSFPGNITADTALPANMDIDYARYWYDSKSVSTLPHGRVGTTTPGSGWLDPIPGSVSAGGTLTVPWAMRNPPATMAMRVITGYSNVADYYSEVANSRVVISGTGGGTTAVPMPVSGRCAVQIIDTSKSEGDPGFKLAQSKWFTVS